MMNQCRRGDQRVAARIVDRGHADGHKLCATAVSTGNIRPAKTGRTLLSIHALSMAP